MIRLQGEEEERQCPGYVQRRHGGLADYSSSSSATSSPPLSLEVAFVCLVQKLIGDKNIREADSRQPRMLSPPQLVLYPSQPYQDQADWSISTYARQRANMFTFFSSSSSSFHFAPRSLPTSPVNSL